MSPSRWLLLCLALILCAGLTCPVPLAASEAASKLEPTQHTCPRCHHGLGRNTTTNVLHCTNPDCNGAYFVDKAGKLQSMIAVATPEEYERLVHPPTPRVGTGQPARADDRVIGSKDAAQQPLDPAAVGTQMFRPPDGGNGGMRVAGQGEGWHPPGYDPNSENLPKIETVAVTCPVCGAPLKEPKTGNRNYQAGVDRDFMRHSLGTFAIHSIVWLCPDCGYAELPEEFAKPVSPAFKQYMLSKVKPLMEQTMIEIVRNNSGDPHQTFKPSELAFHEYIEIKDLPDYLKYERALDAQEQRHKLAPDFTGWDYAVQARVYTEASYACREYLSGTIENGALVRVPIMQQSVQFIRAVLVPRPDVIGNVEAQYQNLLRMQDDFENGSPQQVGRPHYEDLAFFPFYLMLHKAGLEDRLGRALDADKSLRRALQAIPAPGAFTGADEKLLLVPVLKQFQAEVVLRQDLLKREQEYMRRAALNAVVALYLGRYARKDLQPEVYLIAEQMRRVGAIRRSLAWFKFSLELNGDEGPLTAWTRGQMGLEQFKNVLPDEQDKALFEHLRKAWADKNTQTIAACPNSPTDFSLVPDVVATPDAASQPANPATATPHDLTAAMQIFYRSLAAYRKLTGTLPGALEDMTAKGVWIPGDCPELTFKGKLVSYGAKNIKFAYDAGGASGWGNEKTFLLIPAPDNQTAMYVLCGNGKILDLNAPEEPKK